MGKKWQKKKNYKIETMIDLRKHIDTFIHTYTYLYTRGHGTRDTLGRGGS